MIIELAGIKVNIQNRFEYLSQQCREYLSDGAADITVSVTDEMIQKERSLADYPFEDGYFESLCAYREISARLPDFNAFLLHAAAVEVDGEAYLFLAKSGTGKSTHIRLWRKLLGSRVLPINGDKPIIRFFDGMPYACGTPWAGKEGWNRNVRFPIKALCFLSRAEENHIEKISVDDAVRRIMHQVYVPQTADRAEKTLEMIDDLLNKTSLYALYCNTDPEAAKVSFGAMGE